MPSTEHVEKHFTATAAVRDIVIGMSDGLTVPFALAAGLTGAVASTAYRGDRGISGNCSGINRHGVGRISCGEDGFGALRVRTRPRDIARRWNCQKSKRKKWRKFSATTGFRSHRWRRL